MKKQNITKKTLLTSVLSLVLCVAMLIGATFAWFTDNVTSANNKIVAGNLDVQLLMHDGSDYKDISNSTAPIFGENSIATNSANTLWEPGKTQVVYLGIKNNGSLDLRYQVALNVKNPTGGKDLYKAMRYAITPGAQAGDVTAWDATNGKEVSLGVQSVASATALENGATHYFALSVHMLETAGNEYKDGEIDFDLTILATQLSSEEDSFDNQYDKNAGIYVTDADELKEKLGEGKDVILTTKIELEKNVVLRGGTLDGNGETIDAYNIPLNDDCAITTLGGRVENLTLVGNASKTRGIGAGSTGDYVSAEDLYIDNVTIDKVLYAINGSGNDTTKVVVTNSTIYGWCSYSNVELFSFENCKLGMGNSSDGYFVVYGDTSFTNCEFEGVFDMGARPEAQGATITITNCYYDGVKVTADNFVEYFYYGPGDKRDFTTLMCECTIIVDGVQVANSGY